MRSRKTATPFPVGPLVLLDGAAADHAGPVIVDES
jgi:hypothetical protein